MQHFVLRRCGLWVGSVELIHINKKFVRGEGEINEIDWTRFFVRADVRRSARDARRRVRGRLRRMRQTVGASAAPDVEPSRHCFSPVACEFWAHCTQAKPDDWVFQLPGLRRKRYADLREAGIERIADIPADFELTGVQARAREAVRSGDSVVDAELQKALRGTGPPALYLDFETTNAFVPVYRGTRPYQQIPFLWSLHSVYEGGNLDHREFLAEGTADPRRAFAETLIEAIGASSPPILVYSTFEDTLLKQLSEALPDLAERLGKIRSWLVDLLPIVREHVYHPDFRGSFSLKRVAPALAPEVRYSDLDLIAGGAEASAAFPRLVRAELPPEEAAELRRALTTYCERDTLALVEVHRMLRESVS